MSFLNSVLSSIGGTGAAAPSQPKVQNQPGKSGSAGSTPNSTRSATPNVIPPPKRKADESAVPSPPAKIARPNPAAPASTSQAQPRITQPPPPASRPLLKPSASTPNIKARSVASIPSKAPAAIISRPEAARSNGTAPTAVPGKAPVKSSYKAILERAEAAKKAVAEQGTIKHKPVPVVHKLSTKERLAKEEETKRKERLNGRVDKNVSTGQKPQAAGRSSTAAAKDVERPKKAPVDLGYKGTMRPVAAAAPSYTGTMRNNTKPGSSATMPDRSMLRPDRRRSPSPLPGEKRYHYVDDDEDDYYDDESDDMEAYGYDDLEREEAESLRAAQKEDAEALRQENEHRKEKNARKAALQRLADQRKSRGGGG